MSDLCRELLDTLYYHLVLGAPDQATARANLDLVIADVSDLRDTLELDGLDAVSRAIAGVAAGRCSRT